MPGSAGGAAVRRAPWRRQVARWTERRAARGAPLWVSGLFAGAQAALLSFLVVGAPALAAYVATSADPSNADVAWSRSLAVGAALWLMGHGAVLVVDGATVSMVPLGITALALFAGYASARRSAHPSRSGWVAGLGGYALVIGAGVLLAGSAGPLGAGGWSLLRTAVGTLVVAAVGLGAGMVRVRRLRELTRRWWTRIPPLLRVAVTGGTMAFALLVGVAALVTAYWVVSGRAAAGDVVDGLGLDAFSGVLLAVAQLTVAPNLVLWALAWVAGPGFAIGAGTVYAPTEIVSGPLPALPMLGALPPPGSEGGLLRLVPLVLVLVGLLMGWWLHRRLSVTRAWHALAAAGAAALTASVLAALATLVAGGSVGPGRLAVVGGSVALVGLSVAGGTLVGALVTAVPTDPVFRAAVAERARQAWRRARGEADLDLSTGDRGAAAADDGQPPGR